MLEKENPVPLRGGLISARLMLSELAKAAPIYKGCLVENRKPSRIAASGKRT